MHWSLACSLVVALVSSVACARPTPEAETPEPASAASGQVPQARITGPVDELASGEPPSALPIEADDGRLGAAQAPVTLVAFLDYECAFCAQGFRTLLELRKAYPADRLRIVFKHLPLDTHEAALPAAVAGQAVMLARGPEAFFEFSERAFHNQHDLDYVKLAEWADQAGVDRRLYNQLVSDEDTVRRVARDVMLAQSLGISGTPAFFINGRALHGAQPLADFEDQIDEELRVMDGAAGDDWHAAYAQRLQKNLSSTLADSILAKDPDDYRVPVGDSPVLGPEDALVTLVMFNDYQCPFCKRADSTVTRFVQAHPNTVRLVFKHLPLPFHERAKPAARLASQVARNQGDAAFFAVSERLFEASPNLSDEVLRKIGKQAGLDQAQIDEALRGSAELDAIIEADQYLANDVEARGTPHFFMNGKRLTGARPFEHFEALYERQLERAQQRVEEGTPRAKVYAALQEDAGQPGAPERLDREVPSQQRPTKGPSSAPVTIHVFSDFQCPFCRRGEETLQELRKLYPDELRIVWHNLPLPFHDRARPAAKAAMAAYQHGGDDAFWAMHDRIFNLEGNQPSLSPAALRQHARAIGLSDAKLQAALKSESELVERDENLAESLGIQGTPAFVVEGYMVRGAQPVEHFQRVIDLVLSQQ